MHCWDWKLYRAEFVFFVQQILHLYKISYNGEPISGCLAQAANLYLNNTTTTNNNNSLQ